MTIRKLICLFAATVGLMGSSRLAGAPILYDFNFGGTQVTQPFRIQILTPGFVGPSTLMPGSILNLTAPTPTALISIWATDSIGNWNFTWVDFPQFTQGVITNTGIVPAQLGVSSMGFSASVQGVGSSGGTVEVAVTDQTAVPEPGMALLITVGLGLTALGRMKRQRE